MRQFIENKSADYKRLYTYLECMDCYMEFPYGVCSLFDTDHEINEFYNWVAKKGTQDTDEIMIMAMKMAGVYDECFATELELENEARAVMGLPQKTSDK